MIHLNWKYKRLSSLFPADPSVVETTALDTTEVSVSQTDSDNSSSVVPDPIAFVSTRVDFEVSVPAYQSNALQVSITWGESFMYAAWVGDELWSVSTDWPTNTDNTLGAILYDQNGGIELATFNREYRTGISPYGEHAQI